MFDLMSITKPVDRKEELAMSQGKLEELLRQAAEDGMIESNVRNAGTRLRPNQMPKSFTVRGAKRW